MAQNVVRAVYDFERIAESVKSISVHVAYPLRDERPLDEALQRYTLAPTSPEQRTWNTYNFAALWISMAHCIPTYMLASGLIGAGMSWWQALVTILLGKHVSFWPRSSSTHIQARNTVFRSRSLPEPHTGLSGRMCPHECVRWLRVDGSVFKHGSAEKHSVPSSKHPFRDGKQFQVGRRGGHAPPSGCRFFCSGVLEHQHNLPRHGPPA